MAQDCNGYAKYLPFASLDLSTLTTLSDLCPRGQRLTYIDYQQASLIFFKTSNWIWAIGSIERKSKDEKRVEVGCLFAQSPPVSSQDFSCN